MKMMFFKKLILVFALLFGFVNGVAAQVSHTLIITQNQQGLFGGTLKNAPLKTTLKEVAKHTKLDFYIYPQVSHTYNISFNNYSEKKLIDTLTKNLNSYRILAKNAKGVNYTKSLALLPKGNTNKVEQVVLQDDQYNFDFNKRFLSLAQAKKITKPATPNILKLPEVIALLALAEQQKQHDLFYQRIVNPQNLASVYNFKVRYSAQHNMSIPFEKNGKSEQGKAEGFMSFVTVAKAITSKQNSLEPWRNGDDLYLRFKDKKLKDTYIVLNNNKNMEIVQKVGTKGFPEMQAHLIGNADNFNVLAQINHPKATIMLADIVRTQ